MYVSFASVILYFVLEKENRKNPYLSLYVLSFAASGFLYGFGYTLLGLLSMRIVHDITAFMFYSTHNYNRKSESTNFIYTSFLTRAINPLLLTPVLAITINIFYIYLSKISVNDTFFTILLLSTYFGLSIAHYNIEGSVWKKDSIARKYITVV
jgi:hypothetical protein